MGLPARSEMTGFLPNVIRRRVSIKGQWRGLSPAYRLNSSSAAERSRLAGIGVAKPWEIWRWPEALGASSDALEGWRDLDLAGAQAALSQGCLARGRLG